VAEKKSVSHRWLSKHAEPHKKAAKRKGSVVKECQVKTKKNAGHTVINEKSRSKLANLLKSLFFFHKACSKRYLALAGLIHAISSCRG
jgi:hypothetical protein